MRIKRFDQTFFIICDEFEPVKVLKARFLAVLNQIGFKVEKAEEDLTVDDIRFNIKKRVSFFFWQL